MLMRTTDIPLGGRRMLAIKGWPALVSRKGKTDMPLDVRCFRATKGWPALAMPKRKTDMTLEKIA